MQNCAEESCFRLAERSGGFEQRLPTAEDTDVKFRVERANRLKAGSRSLAQPSNQTSCQKGPCKNVSSEIANWKSPPSGSAAWGLVQDTVLPWKGSKVSRFFVVQSTAA